jgi:hypothetical protein
MTSPHLTDEQIAGALCAPAEADAAEHLRACARCRAELQRLQDGVAGYAQGVAEAAPHDEAFWAAQRAEIARRASRRERRRFTAWTAGLAAAASLVLWLTVPRPEKDTAPVPDADQELLLAVQRSLDRGLPAALEPARLLVSDVGAVSSAQ